MKLLVIGSGGREHALAWKLAHSRRVSEIIVAPGNAGTATETKCRNAPVNVTDLEGLLTLAQREAVNITVVGPEVPLVAGIVDCFRAAGMRIFGPTAAAAQLEGSKAYAKTFWLVTVSPRRAMRCIPMSTLQSAMCGSRVPPSSSKPMG